MDKSDRPSWCSCRCYIIFALAINQLVAFSAVQATLPLPLDTEVLLNTGQCASNHTVECYSSLIVPSRVINNASNSHAWCSNVYTGTHHKTGTVLSERLSHAWCNPHYDLTTNDEHIRPSTYTYGRKIAHFIRDPLEMVVSAYQYHLVSTESWLIETGHQAKLKNATLRDGLEIEYARAVDEDITEMIYFHSFGRIGKRSEDVFTVRLEHLRDEFNFRVVEASLKRWFGADANDATPWDKLAKCCFVSPETRQKGAEHISKVDEKPLLRKILMGQHGEEIRNFRRQLGFPIVGIEEDMGEEESAHPDGLTEDAIFARVLCAFALLIATLLVASKILTKVYGGTGGPHNKDVQRSMNAKNHVYQQI